MTQYATAEDETTQAYQYDAFDYFVMAVVIALVIVRFWDEIAQVLTGGVRCGS